MPKSFMVSIFVLAVAVAGAAEWASRRAAAKRADPAPVTARENAPVPVPAPAPAPMPSLNVDRPVTLPAGTRHVLVLGEGTGGFRLNAVTLSEETMAKIDEMFVTFDQDLIGARFVIEGHTDSLGSKDVNHKVGLARAWAVRQYIYGQYEIPLDHINVVSYGAERPVGDNGTQEGRALNRRVVIRVVD